MLVGENVTEVKTQSAQTNPKLRTKLSEYGKRQRTDGPYRDNLECDALIVGGGFAGVFMFWSLKKQGLDVIMYEAGTGYGGTWRWNCYRNICRSASNLICADMVQPEPWLTPKSPSISSLSQRSWQRQ